MVEGIKSQLWKQLRKNHVSTVMIFDRKGNILWHKGREILGSTIQEGKGFPKSHIKNAIRTDGLINDTNVSINVFGHSLSKSARVLDIKAMMITPVSDGIFLYVDSGNKKQFTPTDIGILKVLGELLSYTIKKVSTSNSHGGGISGGSPTAQTLREMVLKFAIEEEPVLLTGETGVGKSHIAELIHGYSGRMGKFVVAEITSVNENLFESIMFGHKKGAFTDAKEDRQGLVDYAKGGTLFIDEVAEVPAAFQSKLLRLIDTKKYRVLGELQEREADIRIVAATNRDLPLAIKNGGFRCDLYYRLQVLEIYIPPLRDRKDDIMDFVNKNPHYLRGKEMGKGFREALLDYHWPGNFRELINVLKRASILLPGPITGKDLASVIQCDKSHAAHHESEYDTHEIWRQIDDGKNFWEVVRDPFLNRELNRSQLRQFISEGLKKSRWKYIELLKKLNLEKKDYQKFMSFLNDHKLK